MSSARATRGVGDRSSGRATVLSPVVFCHVLIRMMLDLKYRLPNPPPIFIGRKTEKKWLSDALKRAPVTVLWGLGGIGKSALALATLHDMTERADSVLYIAMSAGEAGDSVAATVIRGLSSFRDTSPEWGARDTDEDGMIAAMLDMAEQGGRWILVENLHLAPRPRAHRMLSVLARYARTSRWLVTSRNQVAMDELAGQCFHLGPLDARALERAARMLVPRLGGDAQDAYRERIATAVRRAQGSPWRLRRALGSSAATEDPLLDQVSPRALSGVQMLAVIDHALPASVTVGCLSLSEDMIAELVRYGIIAHAGSSLRLHDLARTALIECASMTDQQAWQAQALAALQGQEEPVALVESVRLAILCHRFDLAVHLLDRAGDRLIRCGFAGMLWNSVSECRPRQPSPALHHWRIRLALEVGPAAMMTLDPPDQLTGHMGLLWATVSLYCHRWDEAQRIAHTLQQANHEMTDDVTFEAGLLRSQAYLTAGKIVDAENVLTALAPTGVEASVRRDSKLLTCRHYRDSTQETVARLRDVLGRLADCGPRTRTEVGFLLVLVALETGPVELAHQLIEVCFPDDDQQAAVLDLARRGVALRAITAVINGTLGRAGQLLARVALHEESPGPLGEMLYISESYRRMYAGEWDGVWPRLERSLRGGAVPITPFSLARTTYCALQYLILFPETECDVSAMSIPMGADGSGMAFVFLSQIEHQLRRGQDAAVPETLPTTDTPPALSMLHRLHAIQALLCGRPEALTHARRGARIAADAGFGLLSADAYLIECDVLASTGQGAELCRAAQRLTALAGSLSSPRLRREASLYLWPSCATPTLLLQLTTEAVVAPTASRRARALLGMDAALDELDKRVVSGLRAQSSWRSPRPLRRDDGAIDWIIDRTRTAVWLGDGGEISFADHAVAWSVLAALVDGGGACTKEDLVRAAWQEAEYNPLRHDNRLRLAVRKLRQRLDTKPSQPKRVVTTTEGYALGAGTWYIG